MRRSPLVCTACHALDAEAANRTPFEIFGLAQSYAVDGARLDATYRELSRWVHPDRFVSRGVEEVEAAVRASAALNQAYAILRDPVRRADQLLAQLGGPSASAMRDVPAGFLMAVMELREAIEQAKASGDASAMESLRTDLASRRGAGLDRIGELASRLSDGDSSVGEELRRQLNSMKYLDNLLTEASSGPLSSFGNRAHA